MSVCRLLIECSSRGDGQEKFLKHRLYGHECSVLLLLSEVEVFNIRWFDWIFSHQSCFK